MFQDRTYTAWTSHRRKNYVIALALIAILLVYNPAAAKSQSTVLHDYVSSDDGAFSYQIVDTPIVGEGYTLQLIFMTSQTWRNVQEVDNPLWSHWMAVIVPDNVLTDTSLLFVSGGANDDATPLSEGELAISTHLATLTGSVVTLLGQIPNQPLTVDGGSAMFREDALVAYTWDAAMDTGDTTWAAYLPMTKATVRAMDAVQAHLMQANSLPIERFILTGFSKRAAPVWLAAAIDERISAIAPGVFDFLNMDHQFERHFQAHGFFAPAVQDYVENDIATRLRTPEGQQLLDVIDPFSYIDNLDIPKFLINSPGDQFFVPDASSLYFNNLIGETLIRYVPNTDHSLSDENGSLDNTLASFLGWYASVLYAVPRPTIHWSLSDGILTVDSDQPALSATLWQASNPTARDFRRERIGAAWAGTPVHANDDGRYTIATPDAPTGGWTAYYLELTYAGFGGTVQIYSTEVFVTPQTLPFVLEEPLNNPLGLRVWKQRVMATARSGHPGGSPVTPLADYFPIPVFDRQIDTAADATELLANPLPLHDVAAIQHCLALRLNEADGRLGWYTRITVNDMEKYLWEHWAEAHSAFTGGDPVKAQTICQQINAL